jgi:hypothetical protein
LFCFVDDAHAAAADFTHDAEVAEEVAGCWILDAGCWMLDAGWWMCGVGRPAHNLCDIGAGEAVFQVDDGFEGGEKGFELLEVLGAVGAECVEIDGLAGLEAFGELGDALGQLLRTGRSIDLR